MCTDWIRKPSSCDSFLRTPFDPIHQLAALVAVDQRDQPIADLQTDDVDRLHVVPGQFRGSFAGLGLRDLAGCGSAARCWRCADHIGQTADSAAEQQEDQIRHARDQTEHPEHRCRYPQGPGIAEQLAGDLIADVLRARDPGDR